MKETVRSRLGQ